MITRMKFGATLNRWTTALRRSHWPMDSLVEEPPLRSELFTADQMAQHGYALAASHHLATGRAPDLLLARLAANEAVLLGVCELLTAEATAKRRITPIAPPLTQFP